MLLDTFSRSKTLFRRRAIPPFRRIPTHQPKINQCANMDVRAPPRTLEMGHTKRTQRVPRGALRYFVGDFVIRA